MGAVLISLGGGGGVGSDELTATSAHVLEGEKYVGADTNDEIGVGSIPNNGAVSPSALSAGGSYIIPEGYHNGKGVVTVQSLATMTADADATNAQILEGNKAYVDGALITGIIPRKGAATYYATTSDQTISAYQYLNGTQTIKKLTSSNFSAGNIRNGVKITVNNGSTDVFSVTGNLAVTSAINFKATALSGSSIRISWTNPSKGPWNGVFIQMSTSGSPGTSGGTRAYTGTGVNTTAGGSNYVDITGLSLATTYYFTCTSYCDALGWGSSHNISATTKGYVLYSYGSNPGGITKQKKTVGYSDYWMLYGSDDYQLQMPAIDYSKYTKLCAILLFGSTNDSANTPGVTFYNGSTYVKKIYDNNVKISSSTTTYTVAFDISSASLSNTIKYNLQFRPWDTSVGSYIKPAIDMYKLWLE